MRFLALGLALVSVLCGAGSPSGARAADDRVYGLLGSWTCRTTDDATATHVYVRSADQITFIDKVVPRRLPPYTVGGRFEADQLTGGWTVNAPVNLVLAFHGSAHAWNADA